MKWFFWLLIGVSGLANAQTLVQYDPTGPRNDVNPVAASFVSATITATNLSQNAPDNLGNTDVWPVAAGAFNTNEFLRFTVQPAIGNRLNLQALRYDVRSYLNSNITLRLRSSLDGFAADIGTANSTFNGFRDWTASFNLAGLPRDIASSVEFRIYPDNTGGADFADVRSSTFAGVGVQLIGTSGPNAAVPAMGPAGLGLLVVALALLGAAALRRRLA